MQTVPDSGVVDAAGSEALSLLACPACAGAVTVAGGAGEAALCCVDCGARYGMAAGIPDLRLRKTADVRTEAVRSFYSESPFPNYPPRDSLAALRARAGRSEFAQLLDQAIPADARVLELGCGTGQMSLYLARLRRLVIGADLTRASLLLAGAAARRFAVTRALFIETDLRAPGLRTGAFDVVYSSGVLHHTPDPAAAFRALARLCRPGGVIVLGLYNAYARLPHRLRRLLARCSGYRFIPFDPVLRDRAAEPARRRAWLQDQYHHPEEHRHTLAEVQRWFQENGIEYLRCYPDTLIGAAPLTGAQLFSPADDDWAFENVLAQLSWMARLGGEGGLFVAIGRKTDG